MSIGKWIFGQRVETAQPTEVVTEPTAGELAASALADLNAVVGRPGPIATSEMASLLLQSLCRSFKSDFGAIVWVTGRDRLRCAAAVGADPAYLNQSPLTTGPSTGAPSLAETAESDRGTIYMPDTSNDPRWWATPAWQRGASALVAVPLRAAGRSTAVLFLGRDAPASFEPAEVEAINGFSMAAGLLLWMRLAEEQADGLLKQVTELNEARADFLVKVTHELRTPLAAIKASADMVNDLLAKEKAGSAQSKLLRNVTRNVERLNLLLSDLMDVAKMRDPGSTLNLEQVDVRSVLAQAVSAVAPIARQRGQTLQVEPPPSALSARLDRRRFEQILINLITIASNYCDDKGVIIVRSRREGDRLGTEGLDNGPGIRPAEQEKVFQPFYRGQQPADKPAVAGSGLGLAIVKSLVELHGGSVCVKSELGKGSAFRVELPINGIAIENSDRR